MGEPMAEQASEQIVRLDAWRVPMGLRRGHTMSFGTVEQVDLVVVRATSDSGRTGWGEVTVLGGPYWSEESAESVLAALHSYLFPRVVGHGVHDGAVAAACRPVRSNPFAKCALDIAIADLRARALDVPVAALWGGYGPAPIPLSWSLAGDSLEKDLAEAAERSAAGYRIFKVKMGALPLVEDLDRVTALREALGPDVSLRVDANQGWTRGAAGVALPVLAGLRVAFVEQPLPGGDTAGLAALQSASGASIAADESLRTLVDATALIHSDAARVFVYKLAKHGGFEYARHIAALAEAHGVDGYLGCMIESSLGTAAYLNFAASGVQLPFGCELFGPQLLTDDLTHQPVRYSEGHIHPTTGPGLGVDVDASKVAALASAHLSVTAAA
jgi:muconate cycloisomerase